MTIHSPLYFSNTCRTALFDALDYTNNNNARIPLKSLELATMQEVGLVNLPKISEQTIKFLKMNQTLAFTTENNIRNSGGLLILLRKDELESSEVSNHRQQMKLEIFTDPFMF
jgi:hypothetical protein